MDNLINYDLGIRKAVIKAIKKAEELDKYGHTNLVNNWRFELPDMIRSCVRHNFVFREI